VLTWALSELGLKPPAPTFRRLLAALAARGAAADAAAAAVAASGGGEGVEEDAAARAQALSLALAGVEALSLAPNPGYGSDAADAYLRAAYGRYQLLQRRPP